MSELVAVGLVGEGAVVAVMVAMDVGTQDILPRERRHIFLNKSIKIIQALKNIYFPKKIFKNTIE